MFLLGEMKEASWASDLMEVAKLCVSWRRNRKMDESTIDREATLRTRRAYPSRNRPKGHLVDGLQDLGDFGHPRSPAIRTTGLLTFALAGLSSAEHASLHWSLHPSGCHCGRGSSGRARPAG